MHKTLLLVLIATIATSGLSRAWGQRTQTVKEYFDDIILRPPATLATEEVSRIVRPLETAPQGEVMNALVSIRAAAKHRDSSVSMAGIIALMDIALVRPDGAALLGQQLDVLEDFLNRRDDRFSESALMILGSLKPVPPSLTIPILLRYVERQDAATKRQATALGVALARNQVASTAGLYNHGEQIIEVVERFSRRNLDMQSRNALLDGVGHLESRSPNDPRLVAIVVAGMTDQDASVRKRSLYNLMRLGQAEIRRANVEVERLRTQDPDVEVRAEADKALRVMGGESQFPLPR